MGTAPKHDTGRRLLSVLPLMALGAAGAAGCGGDPDVIPMSSACKSHTDCSGVQICDPVKGICVDPSACMSDADCEQGMKCLSDGTCLDAECEVDSDCCPAGRACQLSCQDYACTGSECEDGGSETCFVGCHAGKKVCHNGLWQPCDAPPLLPQEDCTNEIDDDCNGQVNDECKVCEPGAERGCQSACGSGIEKCKPDGQWGPCDAPLDCTCSQPGSTKEVPCEKCGTRSMTCTPGGTWSDFSLCMGQGACEAGEADEQACGLCGKQSRACLDDCTWGGWGACQVQPDACEPGKDEILESCGVKGTRKKVCLDDCTWSQWSACDESAVCQPGVDTNTKQCGLCGSQVQQCVGGEWGPFGECTGEGACQPGKLETLPCGSCGQKARKCSADCQWQAWGACTGEGACNPGDQQQQKCGPTTDKGLCEYGTQIRTCAATCQWNPWGSCIGAVYSKTEVCGNGLDEDCDGYDKTQPDEHEPNDSCLSCTWLGEDPEVELKATFDNPGDKKDYYCFKGIDNWNIPFTSEHIVVELSNQAVGVDGDLFLYKGYSACEAGHSSALADAITIGGANEEIDWTGDEETTTYIIEVESWGDSGCYKGYTLYIKGLK